MRTPNLSRLNWSDQLNRFPFIAILLVSLFAAAPGVYAALPDKTLIYCSEGSPAGFDPGQYVSTIEYTASARTIYDRLIDFDFERGGASIKPSLATDWHVSPDGRIYTFHLRRGVKFHTTPWFKPTRTLNADDVLFTFERMRNSNLPFSRASPVEFPDWNHAGLNKLITKIETRGPYTVRFTLKSANAPFLPHLAMSFASIQSAEYAAQLLKAGTPSKINWQPAGTGLIGHSVNSRLPQLPTRLSIRRLIKTLPALK